MPGLPKVPAAGTLMFLMMEELWVFLMSYPLHLKKLRLQPIALTLILNTLLHKEPILVAVVLPHVGALAVSLASMAVYAQRKTCLCSA